LQNKTKQAVYLWKGPNKTKQPRNPPSCYHNIQSCIEVIRTSGQTQYVCGDADAIKGGDRFIGACSAWKELFQQAMSKSFGVRDEVRGSAVAIFNLFGVASEKVTSFHLCSVEKMS
jgi:hypothetical protein